jgi:hypothetical protein
MSSKLFHDLVVEPLQRHDLAKYPAFVGLSYLGLQHLHHYYRLMRGGNVAEGGAGPIDSQV